MRNVVCIDIYDNDTLVAATSILCQIRAEPEDDAVVWLSVSLATGAGDGFDPADLEQFIKVIESTTACIEEANITLAEDASVTYETMMRLCAAIGTIRSLRTLSWYGSNSPGNVPHCIKYIAKTLTQARHLVRLVCSEIIFSGEPKEFQELAQAVQRHPTLTEVWFMECTLDTGHSTGTNTIPVLAAFATVPNLTALAVACFFPTGKAAESDPAFHSALRGLCEHPTLRTLDLVGAGGEGIIAVSQAIQSKSSSIKLLWVDTSLQVDELKELGDIIRAGGALKHLHICLHAFEDDEAMYHIIEALNENPKLTKVEFIFDERDSFFSSEIQVALVSMLAEHNYTLQSLSFDLSSSLEVRNENTETLIDYYLTLNRAGRNRLLSNPNAKKEEWITSLASCRGNLDALYYFVSKNPALCRVHRQGCCLK